MNSINLDKIKTVWKSENSFRQQELSETAIHRYIRSRSKSLQSQISKSLIFDLIYKTILLLLFIVILIAFREHLLVVVICGASIFLVIGGILWQIKTFIHIRRANHSEQTMVTLMRYYLEFYNRFHRISILFSALSNSLLFICGSLIYLFYKYKQIPELTLDDLIVLFLGILISYSFSAYFQIKQYKDQIQEFGRCLAQEDENPAENNITGKYRNVRVKGIIWLSVLFILGLVLFIYIMRAILFG